MEYFKNYKKRKYAISHHNKFKFKPNWRVLYNIDLYVLESRPSRQGHDEDHKHDVMIRT